MFCTLMLPFEIHCIEHSEITVLAYTAGSRACLAVEGIYRLWLCISKARRCTVIAAAAAAAVVLVVVVVDDDYSSPEPFTLLLLLLFTLAVSCKWHGSAVMLV
jgi:peptidoglycan/LPS O-acetylase OafA/YrhL